MKQKAIFLLALVFLLFALVQTASADKTSNYQIQEQPFIPTELAVAREGNIWLVSLDGNEPERQLTFSGKDCCLNWSPDGRILYFAREETNWSIYAYSFDEGIESKLNILDSDIEPDFVITPDGTQLFSSSVREVPYAEGRIYSEDSCLLSFNISSESLTEIDCYDQVTMSLLDINSQGSEILTSNSAFESTWLSIYDINDNEFNDELVCCYFDGIFNSKDDGIFVGSPFCYFCEPRGIDPGYGIHLLGISPPTDTHLSIAESSLTVSQVSTDGTLILYAQDGEVKVYNAALAQAKFVTLGSYPKWRPAISYPLPPDFEKWLAQKESMISELESPPFFNGDWNQPNVIVEILKIIPIPNLPDYWGYDEAAATDLIIRLKADLELYNQGLMAPDEQQILAAEAEAFGRLFLVEQSYIELYPQVHSTIANISEGITNVASITIGSIRSLKGVKEAILSDINPFSEVMLRLIRKAERKLLDFADKFINFSLGLTPDPDLRKTFQDTWEVITRYLNYKFDEELGTNETLVDILFDDALGYGLTSLILMDHFGKTQPLLDGAVQIIEEGSFDSTITGSFLEAQNHQFDLQSDAQLYTEFTQQRHEEFQQLIDRTELAATIGYISTGLIGFIGTAMGVLSTLVGLFVNNSSMQCQADHLHYLRQTMVLSAEYAFDANQPKTWSSPSHCAGNDGSQSLWLNNQVASLDSFWAPVNRVVQLQQTEAGEALQSLQTQLNELELLVQSGNLLAVEENLDDLFDLEEAASLELKVQLALVSQPDSFALNESLLQSTQALDFQTAVLYANLVSYFAQRGAADNQVLEEISKLEQIIQQLLALPVPENSAPPMNFGKPVLIGSIDVPDYVTANESFSISITLVNLINEETSGYNVLLTDGDETIASIENISVDPNSRKTLSLDLDGFSTSEDILFLQLLNASNKVEDSATLSIYVLLPEVVTNLVTAKADQTSNPSNNENNTSLSPVIEPPQRTPINPVIIGGVIALLIGGIIIGVYSYQKNDRRLTIISICTTVLLSSGLVVLTIQPNGQEEIVETATPIIPTTTAPTTIYSLEEIQARIAETAEALTMLLPTGTPSPQPTNTPTPQPTVTPTPIGQGERLVIGESFNGNAIEAVRFGYGQNVLLVVGGIHGGFAPSTVALPNLLVEHYTNNLESIPEDVSLYIIPTVNPDTANTLGDFAGRVNGNGVDLNRNADCRWSPNPSVLGAIRSEAGGDAPFSEPESQALVQFIENEQPYAVLFYDGIASNGFVEPGKCDERHTPSERLATIYSGATGYTLADFSVPSPSSLTGDMSYWLVTEDIPALFVILPDFREPELATNLAGIEALLNEWEE